MKKFISVLLALIMVMSCFGVMASAAVNLTTGTCICANHVESNCTCCVYCPTLSESAKADCLVREQNADGSYTITVCNAECTGLAYCTCSGCEYDEDYSGSDAGAGALIPEDVQDDIVTWFQLILSKVSTAFDEFFEAIFEFLRLEDVLGRTE